MCREPPPGSPEDGVAPDLLFLRVPEAKAVKSRLHLDLRPTDQAAEVARLEALGARRVAVGQGPEVSWGSPGRPRGQRVLRAAHVPARRACRDDRRVMAGAARAGRGPMARRAGHRSGVAPAARVSVE
ncbi:MAG: VOC family protein [Streptosporangiaceae bacterium]